MCSGREGRFCFEVEAVKPDRSDWESLYNFFLVICYIIFSQLCLCAAAPLFVFAFDHCCQFYIVFIMQVLLYNFSSTYGI